ncbi:hypothetical protein AB0F68_09495 [Micromonospora sp. NPDC023966]|uniref:hypothetical protein n=1 Tax=Micromonospora sp. NPDC023966 TaxID=3154699 RepID=UPI003404A77C
MRTAAARIGPLAGAVLLAACAPTPTPDRASSESARPAGAAGTAPPAPACSPEGIRITELGVDAAMGLRAMGLELDGPIDLGNTGRLGVGAWKRDDRPSSTQPPAPSGPPSSSPTPDSRL